jgi:hypothetical protein
MSVIRRLGACLTAATTLALGCRTMPSGVSNSPLAPPAPPLELTPTTASSLEPDYPSLPRIDATTIDPHNLVPVPGGYRDLTEEICRREAAARAPAARLLSSETATTCPTSPADQLRSELRVHLDLTARNQSAQQALESFFQLADAEGRGDLLRSLIRVLDPLRATAHKARAEGVRLPLDPDDLDRQRSVALGLLDQADLGAAVLDIDLKRRIGYPGRGNERLRPRGPFPVAAGPLDVEAAIQVALERRADLRMLRTLYLRMTPETLPAIREILQHQPEARGVLGTALARPATMRTALTQRLLGREAVELEAATLAELAVRRQQVLDLILDRERQAADDVRTAAAALAAQTRQVGLARWRVEHAERKAAEAAGQGPLVTLPAELEVIRARAEAVAAVMAWHQARVRLLAAQGLLVDEPVPPNGG